MTRVRIITPPTWFKRLVDGRWFGFADTVVENSAPDPYLLAHELEHIRRQDAMGKWLWLLRYYTSRSFRLQEEAEAFAAETFKRLQDNPQFNYQRIQEAFAEDLAGSAYLWAAEDVYDAEDALILAIENYKEQA